MPGSGLEIRHGLCRASIALAAVAAVAAIATGCGGGGSSAGSSRGAQSAEATSQAPPLETSSLDKEEFIKKADAACEKQSSGLLNELTSYLQKHESEKLAQPVLIANMAKAVLLPAVEAEIAAVRKLGAPAGDEEEVEAVLAAQEAAVEEVEQLRKAQSIEEIEDHFFEATKLYQEYGFKGCTRSP